MMMRTSLLASVALALCLSAPLQSAQAKMSGAAETGTMREQAAATPLPAEVTTTHTVEVNGKVLKFKAQVGAIPLYKGEGGERLADIGYVAFSLEGSDVAKRPLTFAINGGPGAGSVWLNLGALGPWRLPMEGESLAPSAPPVPVANAESWLEFTDLVFLDPVGTGYSKALAKSDEAKSLFTVEGDIDALAVSIRKWIAANKRAASPKFLVGESYGGFRAPRIARALAEKQDVGLDGLILVSPVLDFAWMDGVNNPLPHVARLPSYAAANRKIATDPRGKLGDVEDYAAGEFLVDLLKAGRNDEALNRMAGKVSEFTGIPPAIVKRFGGRVEMATFARESRRSSGQIVSLYDADVAGFNPAPRAVTFEFNDPILDSVKTPLAAAMGDLVVNRLKWPVEGRYESLNGAISQRWDWGRARRSLESTTALSQALALDVRMKALVVHGASDLVTPYFASKLLLDQVAVMGSPDRVKFNVYPGGHMFYAREISRKAFRDDARAMMAK